MLVAGFEPPIFREIVATCNAGLSAGATLFWTKEGGRVASAVQPSVMLQGAKNRETTAYFSRNSFLNLICTLPANW